MQTAVAGYTTWIKHSASDEETRQAFGKPPLICGKRQFWSRSNEKSNSSGQESRITSPSYFRAIFRYPTKGGVVHVLFAFGLWNQCSGIHTVTVLTGYGENLQ
jgi:hypothetical protein